MAVNPFAIPQVVQDLQAGGKSPEQIIAKINSYIEKAQNTTVSNRAAQRERADRTRHIRAGGAPNNKSEAIGQIQLLTRLWEGAMYASGGWDRSTQRQKIKELAEKIQEVDKNIKAHVAILFKSGGPFLYPSSVPSDYAELVAAGSKGKEVWRRGWGPDRHPSYVFIQIDPDRLIDSRFVSSSWLVAIYLIAD